MQRPKIIYEDKWILVVDKPPGIITAPFSPKDNFSLLQLLNKESPCTLYPCHRLDKETSGLVIFAKDKETQKKIMDLFRKKRIKKKYIGVVHGWIDKKRGKIENFLFDGFGYKLSITHYRVMIRRPEYSVLEIEPVTGRKNQIRIHFKQIGHPILGERKYALARNYELKAKRLLLHALELEFPHPENGKILKLSSSIPEEIKVFISDSKGGGGDEAI